MSSMKISPIKVPFWAIVILLATTGGVTLTTLTVSHVRRSLERKKSYGDLADLLERGRLLEKLRRESDCRLQVPVGEDKDLLVCVSPSQRRWIVVGCEGAKMFFRSYTDGLEFRTRTFDLPTEKKLLQIFCTEARLDFYCGEHILRARAPQNWRWLVAPIGKNLSAGEERISVFRSVLKEDGFQRRSFGRNDGWMVEEGSWHTLMRGGGEGNAANAFVLTARHQSGLRPTVRTGWKLCANYTVLVSARPASPQATYRFMVGNKEGSQVSFGWDGDRRVWTLKYFGPDDRTWTYDYDRVVLPPGNWQRFGLRLKSPFEVVPLRGGRELEGKRLPGPVFGRVRIRAENAPVYFDDFQLRGRDIPAVRATPLHVESRSFAGKKVNEKKDEGFVKWAHDTLSCKRTRFKTSEGTVPANRYRIPLYGDFTYKGPSEGCNRVLLKLADEKGADVRMAFIRQKQRWWYCGEQVGGHLTRGGQVNVPRLRLYCRNGAIYMDGQPKKPLRHLNLDRPIYLTVATPGLKLEKEKHEITSYKLWDEFFETSPFEWVWQCGSFGMQYRWGCQKRWNWMGGWSDNLAMGFSRARYDGGQSVEYYVCMKDLLEGINKRRYMRRDLNFSFCTDGRNIASGYSLVFGGFGSGKLYFLKGGEVLASTGKVRMPSFPGTHHDVHWRWWHFRVEKRGGHIKVFADERKVFDVHDEDPISGGHLAFWSLRDGFLLARVRIAAARRTDLPQKFEYVPNSGNEKWKALDSGCVGVSQSGQMTEVRNRIGGGVFAVRWQGAPRDLSDTPVMELPFRAARGAKVNLHLQISGRCYVVPLTAPRNKTPFALCPRWRQMQRKQLFYHVVQAPQMDSEHFLDQVQIGDGKVTVDLSETFRAGEGQLESLVVGNVSNNKYLLAGFSGNASGARYWLGRPSFRPQSEDRGAR